MNALRLFLLICISTLVIACTTTELNHDEEGFFSINGSDIYYKIIGKGEPIIVIHGGPVLDHSYFLPQFEALKEDYQLIFYDQRVCGKSGLGMDSSTMNIDGFIDDIALLADSLGLKDPHILGHSWGGLLAMKYAIKYPDTHGKLVLSNSMPPSAQLFQEESETLATRTTPYDSLRRARLLQSDMMKEFPGITIQKIMMIAFKNQFSDTTRRSQLNLTIPHDYMERSQRFFLLGGDISSYNIVEKLASIKRPTLILYRDTEPAAEITADIFIENIPDVRLEIIPDCGHFPFVEKPEDYFRIIKEFLK